MNQQATMTARLTVLRAGPERLRDAMLAGYLTGQALHQCEAVAAENAQLRRENADLVRENLVLGGMVADYRRTHRAALDGRMRRWRVWMWHVPSLGQGFVLGFGAAVVVVSAIFAAVLMMA